MTWNKALQHYFGMKLTPDDIRDWQDELRESTKADGQEVAEAIKWASWKDRSEYKGKPTLKEVRMWVFWKRKEDGKGCETDELDGCDACAGSGWIHSYHGIYYQNGAHIPCACSKGGEMMAKYPQEYPENVYKPLARKAIQEQVRRNKIAEQLTEETE